MENKKVVVMEVVGDGKTEAQVVKENIELERELSGNKNAIQEALKERKRSKEVITVVDQKDRSLNIGVVGVGQCGSKLAEEFYNRGYNVVAINTAIQDLKLINIPERQKLFLDYALGGAAKDLDVGAAAAQEFQGDISAVLEKNFADNDVMLLCLSGGGGTGSGSAETMVQLLSQLGKPLMVMFVLPLNTDDLISKHNSTVTLSKLAAMASKDVINSLMIVDNAKVQSLYSNLSISNFWKVANSSIVEPLHLFNKLSAIPSAYTSLDPMDLAKVLIGAGDCTLYGNITVEDYTRDEAVAEAILTTMENGLLATDFDLTQTRSAGVIITGNKAVLEQIPASSLEYGFAMLSKICNEGTRIYRGIYEVADEENAIKVYGIFSGLGLPEKRVEELKSEAEKHMNTLQTKETARTTNMNIDIGKTQTVSAADAIHKRITQNKSAMGKLTNNSKRVIDKRRT